MHLDSSCPALRRWTVLSLHIGALDDEDCSIGCAVWSSCASGTAAVHDLQPV